MFVVLVVSFFGVVGEVAIEENLPTALERWSGPAAVHAKEFGDRNQTFCQRVGEAALACFEAGPVRCQL